jgi:putative NADH-flavin reductase
MRIGIIGASGNIGSRILAEAATRGHEVMAFTRNGAAGKGPPWRDLDIFDLPALRAAVASADVIVSSYQPGNAARDLGDAIRSAISDPTAYARAAANLLKALESRSAARLIVVGGAASLEIAPGQTTDDDDVRLREVLRGLGVPEDYAVAVKGHRDALNFCASPIGAGPTSVPQRIFVPARARDDSVSAPTSCSWTPRGVATSPMRISRLPSSTKSRSPGISSVGLPLVIEAWKVVAG